MKKTGIYKIVNINNNKFYLGSSIDIDKRWNRHKYELNNNRHHNKYLQRAWNKHGEDSFVFEVSALCDISEIQELEQQNLDAYFGSDICYNISPNVSGGDILSTHPNREEIIEKITKEVRKNVSKLTKEERRNKWARYGENNPNYGNGEAWTYEMRKKVSELHKDRFKSAKERKRISDVIKKYFSNPDNRKKLSELASQRTGDKNPFYGKHHSEETKEKLRKANTGKKPINMRKVSIDGVIYESVAEAARKLGVCSATIIHRIKSKNKKFCGYFYRKK